MKNHPFIVFALAFTALIYSSQATVILDFRPIADGAANPGDGVTRINVTSGSSTFPLSEVATPIFGQNSGNDGTFQGDAWGGSGLNINGNTVTFTNTEIVDFDGSTATAQRELVADAIGLGMGIRSDNGNWFLLDGQESFTWNADVALQFEGLTLRNWATGQGRALAISSPGWVGLLGVSPGTGVSYTSGSGTFLIEELTDNVAIDRELTLAELVGISGPTLDFSTTDGIKVATTGTLGFAIQTMSFDAVNVIPEPGSASLLLVGLALLMARGLRPPHSPRQ